MIYAQSFYSIGKVRNQFIAKWNLRGKGIKINLSVVSFTLHLAEGKPQNAIEDDNNLIFITCMVGDGEGESTF